MNEQLTTEDALRIHAETLGQKGMPASRQLLLDSAAEMALLRGRLAACRLMLEEIVCTEDDDAGVVLLSQDGPTHPERRGDRTIQVYDHMYFSPLGDALIALWNMTDPNWKAPTDA